MTKEEQLFNTIGKKLTEAQVGQLFGKPCFKINGKAFACLFEGCMAFKLAGEQHTHALSLDGSVLFDPSARNRPMKEWVQVHFSHHEQWEGFAKAALSNVGLL